MGLTIMSLVAAGAPQGRSEPTPPVAATSHTILIPPSLWPAGQNLALDPTASFATQSPTRTPKPTPKPTPKKYRDTVTNARAYVKRQVGVTQYNCINYIWTRESKWNPRAENPTSGAYGIPQAHPGNKMARFGSNWRYSPLTQVRWGLWYVKDRYGSACKALAFFKAHGWY